MRTIRLLLFCFASLLSLNSFSQNCGWFGGALSNHLQVEGQSVVINNKMYVFYGFVNSTQITSVVEEFDPFFGATGKWTQKASMLVGVTHVDVLVVDDEAWLFGGFVGNHGGPSTDVVQIYNPSTNSWRYGPTLPKKHASGGTGLIGRKIHVYAGLKPDRATNKPDHWVYDLDNPGAGWDTTYAKHPFPRDHMGSLSMRGKLYSVGGQTGHDGPNPTQDYDTVEVYDPYTDSWSTLADMPQTRSHIEPGSFTLNGKIYVTGGNTSPCCPALRKEIIVYDPDVNSWSTVCDMPTFLTAPAAKVINNRYILAHGGEYGFTNPQNKTYMFNIVSAAQNDLKFNPPQLNISLSSSMSKSQEVILYTISGETSVTFNHWAAPSWLTVNTGWRNAEVTGKDIQITVDASGLSPGQYTFTLTASASGFTGTSLPITLTVTPPPPLPVELVMFDAHLQTPNKVDLTWITASETNVDRFEVERRHEQIEGFQTVASVKSAGIATGSNYDVVDDVSNLPKGQVYYRLKMIDTNGDFSYSPMREVYLNDQVLHLDVYPNPASDHLFVEMINQRPANSIRLIDLKGRVVVHQQEVKEVGQLWQHRLNVEALVRGCYLLEIVVGDEVLVKKVVIE